MSHQPQQHNASANAVSLLHEYRQRRQEFQALQSYDDVMHALRVQFGERIAQLHEPLQGIAKRLFTLADQGFFLLQVCEWKIDYLADALIHSITTQNPLALANNTRALIEHLGAFVAVAKELEHLTDALRGQNSEAVINRALERTDRFLHRAYYGRSPKSTNDKQERALHAESDCIAALKDDISDIEDVYAFLCEYVHPNYGSNALVSTGQLAKGRLNPPPEHHRETTQRMLQYCALAMAFLKDEGIGYAGVILRLQAMLELCLVPLPSSAMSSEGRVLRHEATAPHGKPHTGFPTHEPNMKPSICAMNSCCEKVTAPNTTV